MIAGGKGCSQQLSSDPDLIDNLHVGDFSGPNRSRRYCQPIVIGEYGGRGEGSRCRSKTVLRASMAQEGVRFGTSKVGTIRLPTRCRPNSGLFAIQESRDHFSLY